jgi:(2Fe-2S) ferredoxin
MSEKPTQSAGQQHMFFCMNKSGGTCCKDQGAKKAEKEARRHIKELDLKDGSKIRVNETDCLGHCSEGPVVLVYPSGVYYRYDGKKDIDEIIDKHLVGGKIVKRLRI